VGRVAIITDSTADLPPALAQRHGITVVPLNVHFGSEVFRDQLDITTDRFLERLQQSSVMPTTSQPSAGLFEETFRRLGADHDEIVAVLISSKLSGTLQSATIAAESVGEAVPVEIVDSLNGSLGLGFQAVRAAELAAEGLGAAEIAGRLRAETGEYHVVFFVDTLEYLQRGGRIGRAAALLGGFLNLKPLLRVDEGQVVPYERTRTRAKAVQGLVDFVRGLPQVERLGALYSTSEADAAALADRLAEAAGVAREAVTITQMGPVIGVHLGPGAMGVAVFEGAGA
jgi:DegV family protein with EDD domain